MTRKVLISRNNNNTESQSNILLRYQVFTQLIQVTFSTHRAIRGFRRRLSVIKIEINLRNRGIKLFSLVFIIFAMNSLLVGDWGVFRRAFAQLKAPKYNPECIGDTI